MGLREWLRALATSVRERARELTEYPILEPASELGAALDAADQQKLEVIAAVPIVADPVLEQTVDCAPTPIPAPRCQWCEEELGESAHPAMTQYHMECAVRVTAGPLAHIEQKCSCFVRGSNEHDPPGLTKREAAMAAYKKVRERWVGLPN